MTRDGNQDESLRTDQSQQDETSPPDPCEQSNNSPPDPFDPESLRLSDSTSFGVEKVLTTVPCNKPNKHVFVRAHPAEEYRLDTGLFFDRAQNNEPYLVSRAIRDSLAGDVVAVRLVTGVTRHGDVFLWPVRLPGPTVDRTAGMSRCSSQQKWLSTTGSECLPT